MPEYPEVYCVIDRLKNNLINEKIVNIEILSSHVFEDYKNELNNKVIKDIRQAGKYILFLIEDYVLISHLRLEGKFYINPLDNYLVNKHTHAIFNFKSGKKLYFQDIRKFAKFELRLISNYLKTPPLLNLAKDPYKLGVIEFYNNIKKRKTNIKTILLNQEVISGIGNIYADEILFETCISPYRISSKITQNEASKILETAKKIFDLSKQEGGTTIYSYSSGNLKGNYQNFLKVHTKENCNCPKCGNKIKKVQLSGRGTYYCEYCQK